MTPSSGQDIGIMFTITDNRNIKVEVQVQSPLRLGKAFCFYGVTLNLKTQFVLANKELFVHKTIKFARSFLKNAKQVRCYCSQ